MKRGKKKRKNGSCFYVNIRQHGSPDCSPIEGYQEQLIVSSITKRGHGSCNCSLMSSILKELLIMSSLIQELLVQEQYNFETRLVSCCFASGKIPQYNGSGKDATISQHGSCNCSMMSSIIQELLFNEQSTTIKDNMEVATAH